MKLAPLDWAAAGVCVLAAVELTRRLTGYIIPTLIVVSVTYVGWWGSMIGGVFSFPGLSWETVAFRSIYGDEAMFEPSPGFLPPTCSSFIIFGAFLLRSGAGDFVIDLARAVAGKLVGGPGIVAGDRLGPDRDDLRLRGGQPRPPG